MKSTSTPRLWTSLMMFIAAYFPLALIFAIQDLHPQTFLPRHPVAVAVLGAVVAVAVAVTLAVPGQLRLGLQVQVHKASNRSADMYTYALPYLLSVGRYSFADWQILTGTAVFLALMFVLMYRTQTVFLNPVLALAGYGLYDCQFRHAGSDREYQGLVLSKREMVPQGHCTVARLAHHLYVAVDRPSGAPQ